MSFDQEQLDQELANLRQACSENGDEFCMEQLQNYATKWKAVVAESIRAQTIAIETEQTLLPQIQERLATVSSTHEQISEIVNGINDLVAANDTQIEEKDATMATLKAKLNDAQNELKSLRSELSGDLSGLDTDRVKKFGKMMDQKNVQAMCDVAKVFKALLSSDEANDSALFTSPDKLRFKINQLDAGTCDMDMVKQQVEVLKRVADLYTEEGSKKSSFTKTFKYNSIYNLAVSLVDVIFVAHDVNEAQAAFDAVVEERQVFVDDNEVQHLCLEDMNVYDIEGLEAEKTKLSAIVERATGDRTAETIKMQERFKHYENQFFQLVNDYKHKSMVQQSIVA